MKGVLYSFAFSPSRQYYSNMHLTVQEFVELRHLSFACAGRGASDVSHPNQPYIPAVR